ncbi:hypothetical protein TKK_0005110 [Trichogramma kaykai]
MPRGRSGGNPVHLPVSKLMSHRDRPFRCDRNPGVLARVGQGVNLAVERFVTVAETIADDNPDVKQDMYEACKEARVAGMITLILSRIKECEEGYAMAEDVLIETLIET